MLAVLDETQQLANRRELSHLATWAIKPAKVSRISFLARALRIPTAKRDRLTPRVLAAGGPRHSDHAVRPARRLHDWEIPLLDQRTVREADAMLTRLDKRRALADQELAALEEIVRIAASGLTNGTLTVRFDQEM